MSWANVSATEEHGSVSGFGATRRCAKTRHDINAGECRYISLYTYKIVSPPTSTMRSRVHESPGNETIIEVFWPVEFWIEEKMAIFEDPEN